MSCHIKKGDKTWDFKAKDNYEREKQLMYFF